MVYVQEKNTQSSEEKNDNATAEVGKEMEAAKDVDGFVWVDQGGSEEKPDVLEEEHVCQDITGPKDALPEETMDVQEIEDGYETDFCESDGDHEISGIPKRHDDVPTKERTYEDTDAVEGAKSIDPDNESKKTSEKPVVEIPLEFLELMEGFCMAVTQEFPSDLVDFAAQFFTRISKKRNQLRKYSIELSDQALFSEVAWSGTI